LDPHKIATTEFNIYHHCKSVAVLPCRIWVFGCTTYAISFSVQELLSLHCKTDDPWCRITYHQYRDHVGTPGSSLPVYTDSVHVFSGLHHGAQGLCLSAVRPTAAVSITSEVSENAQIILLMLYIARSMLSQDVRLSVHHTPVLCQNG